MKSSKDSQAIWPILLKNIITSKVIWGIVGVLFLIGFFLGQAISYGTISKAEDKNAETKYYYVVSAEGLNMRLSPDYMAKSIMVMPYGAKLAVIDIEGDWVLINYSEKYGWAKIDFLTKEKPKELSIRDIDFNKLLKTRQGIESLLPVEYFDYNNDGREEALLTVLKEGTVEEKEFYLYGYKDGITFTKYLDLRPEVAPQAFVQGYMGHDKLEFKNGKFTLSYPLYKIEEPNCCPTGGTKVVDIVYEKDRYIIK